MKHQQKYQIRMQHHMILKVITLIRRKGNRKQRTAKIHNLIECTFFKTSALLV